MGHWDCKSCGTARTPVLQGRLPETNFSTKCKGLLSAPPHTSRNPRDGVPSCPQMVSRSILSIHTQYSATVLQGPLTTTCIDSDTARSHGLGSQVGAQWHPQRKSPSPSPHVNEAILQLLQRLRWELFKITPEMCCISQGLPW